MKPRVVIIGGGILGAAAAWALSRAGDRVVLLEKGSLVSGASGANLGQISLIDRLEPWHMEAALSSLRIYTSLPPQAKLEYQQTGGVVTLEDEAQYTASQPVAAQLAALGVSVEYRAGPEARQTEPALDSSRIKALLYCSQEGKLNPLSTTWAFLDMAREAGAELHPHTPVTGFVQTGERIAKVCTAQGEFEADLVVNAAGAWSKEVAGLLGLDLPLDYHRAAAFVSQPVPPIIRGPVVGGGMFLKRTSMHMRRHIGTGCVQTACGSILIAQATEDAPVDSRAVTLPGLCLVAKRFLHYFPTLEDLEIVRAWACVTPFTPDGLPVFGFSWAVPNFFTAAGFKGAFTTAPAVALHLVEALHRDAVWDGHFSPDRTGEEETPCNT